MLFFAVHQRHLSIFRLDSLLVLLKATFVSFIYDGTVVGKYGSYMIEYDKEPSGKRINPLTVGSTYVYHFFVYYFRNKIA